MRKLVTEFLQKNILFLIDNYIAFLLEFKESWKIKYRNSTKK